MQETGSIIVDGCKCPECGAIFNCEDFPEAIDWPKVDGGWEVSEKSVGKVYYCRIRGRPDLGGCGKLVIPLWRIVRNGKVGRD